LIAALPVGAPRFDARRIVGEVAATALIVDDHAPFRAAARRVVEAAGLEVIAVAENGEAALAAASAWRPHVVLLDVRLRGLDGLEVARRLAARPAPPIVVLMSADDALVDADLVRTSRARGFLAKRRLRPQTLLAMLSSSVAPQAADTGGAPDGAGPVPCRSGG
jgi:CheY-like chemotaxis protein